MKRDYISEILDKKRRLRAPSKRIEEFNRRVYPLVEGVRAMMKLPRALKFRDEWLKYGAIGYIACVEGYFRLLLGHLIDRGAPFVDRVAEFDQIRFGVREVIAVHSSRVTIGEYVAHLLPLSSVADINRSMSVLLGQDFLGYLKGQPVSQWNDWPFGKVFPQALGEVEELFRLRHLFCHELATRETVPVRKIERGVSGCAAFVTHTEECVARDFLA